MTKASAQTESDRAWTWTIAMFMLLSMPLLSLLSALIYRAMWNITLATQYGDGPTLKSWFGISVVSMMLLHTATAKKEDDEDAASRESLIKTMKSTARSYVVRLSVLLFAWGTCWALGWS